MIRKLSSIVITIVLMIGISGIAEAGAARHLMAYAGKEISRASAPAAQTKQFADGATYTLCFVPDGPRCEDLIVNNINNTTSSLLIQAYSFTSAPIAKAVIDAFKRGVDVRVIVDKSQVSEKYTSATFIKNAGIPIVVDTKPAIAHNKIIIFDQQAVFTGSFNFSKAAQKSNCENGIVIRGDANIVKEYTSNWLTRQGQSVPY